MQISSTIFLFMIYNLFVYDIHYDFKFYLFYSITELSCPKYFSKLPFDNKKRRLHYIPLIISYVVKDQMQLFSIQSPKSFL